MKKILLTLCVAFASIAMYAAGLEGVRIYVNPGHGSWSANDRPMATIPYPNLANGMPDTCGFYESNTNLWKCLELGRKLEAAGAEVTYSRTANGPYPYTTKAEYDAHPDRKKYDVVLSEMAETVESNGYDYFISVHSNAATEGTTTNYPLLLYRGTDDGTDQNGQSKEIAQRVWPYLFEAMNSGIDPYSYYSLTKMNIRGDVNFYKNDDGTTKATYTTLQNGKRYFGYLGALKHGVPGMLSEGYFHTYQPARHRALNPDYCKQEGIRYYRGLAAWFGEPAEEKGYIMGTVKDEHEKIVHDLFKYSANTNDQWLPCNGAVVKLLKGGLEIAEYTVDNNYNGLFYFPDLEPGLYTLEVSCEGYKELAEKYKEPIVVEANKTSYPMVFLENVNYVPDEIVYEDYPDQALEGITLAEAYDMEKKGEESFLIEGKIKRTIGIGDSTIVLSHTADSVAHLYLIDHLTGNIATISTEGIVADKENAGEYLSLSDIAYTSDGKLVGCNYIRCQFNDQQVDANLGVKRGTLQFYKWDNLMADPVKWISSQHSANSNRSDQGLSFAVSGPSDECTILVSGQHSGTNRGVRYSQFTVIDNQIVAEIYTMAKFAADNPYREAVIGPKFLLQLSPRDTKNNWILDGSKAAALEMKVVGSAKDHEDVGQFADAAYGTVFTETNFIKYAGRILSIAPYEVEGKVGGVRVYDVTDGLDKAVLVQTNADLDLPLTANFAAATLAVNGATWTIYLFLDNEVVTFAEAPVEIKPASHLNAYASQLRAEQTGNDIKFSYFLNAPVNAAEITLRGVDTEDVLTIHLTGLTQGAHTQSVDISALGDGAYTWELTVEGDVVTEVSADLLAAGEYDFWQPRGFAVDNNPKSPHFGQYYVSNSAPGNNASKYEGQEVGIYVLDPIFTIQGHYTGGVSWTNKYGPMRLYVDEKGLVFASNHNNSTSNEAAGAGIWIMDPATPTTNFKALLDGTAHGNCSGIAGFDFVGEGADRILVASSGVTYSSGSKGYILKYAVGASNETFTGTPDTIASAASLSLGNQYNTVLGDGRGGLWICQNRGNEGALQCLAHVNASGKKDYDSNTDKLGIGGSGAGALALNEDKTLLAIGADRVIKVYAITWAEDGKPVLTYKYETGDVGTNVSGVAIDYAGNIFTGTYNAERLRVFATPTDGVVTTPAREEITITKLAPTAATALEISAATLTLAAEETAMLTATPTPADAVGLVYTWTSDKPEVATVVNGVVTAVAPGEATISVSATNDAMDAPITAECKVTVTETAATSVALSQEAATLYAGDQIRLGYEIAPANAIASELTWTSTNDAVATVVDGIVTAVAPGEAKIAIAVKNGAMTEAVTDTCVITVPEYIAATGVTLSIIDTLIAKGATFTLKETIAPEGAMEVLKLWSSDNTAVATVVNGVVTAVDAGETTIRLRVKSIGAAEVYEATCKVQVMVAVNAAMINEKEVTITEGETSTLTLQYAPKDAADLTIKWISSNEEVATVVDGVVTAVAPGETEITISLQNAVMAEPVTATCKVTVEKKPIAVTSVILSAVTDTLEVGETLTLEATIAPEDAATPTITWSTSDEVVATVTDGVVTAVAEGKAIITVSVINEAMTEAVTATCEVVVRLVNGLLTIETSGIYYSMETIHNPQGLALQVFNINGQLVATGNGDIDMRNAAQGIYIVRCQVGTLKFVK